ncbi:MAG: hypothetical protein AB8U44_03815 [Aaplasma endosymbiont of Hyalomma asiaticum]
MSSASGSTDNSVSAALGFMKQNALDYSKADIKTLNNSAKVYLLRVLGDAEASLKDLERRLETFEATEEETGLPTASYVEILRKKVQEVRDILVGAKCGLERLEPSCSSEEWLHQVLSPQLRSSVSKISEMLMALWHTESCSICGNDSFSIFLESTILSLSHLASTIDNIGHSPVETSGRHLDFMNTATRAAYVIAESMREIATVTSPEFADRIHREIMLVTEVSSLVSPYTRPHSIVDFCHYSSCIVCSAGALMREVPDANIREQARVPIVNGLKSIIAAAVYVYWSTLEQMLIEKEVLISELGILFHEGSRRTHKGLLSYSKKPYENGAECVVFLRMELLECVLNINMFERKYLKLIAESGALISNVESDAVKGHVRDLKQGMLYALIGACEYTGRIGDGMMTETSLLHSIYISALYSLQSLECVLQCLGSQTIKKDQNAALLRPLGSVAALLNRALDRLDESRELYNHNWDPVVSGVMLFPEELPKNRKLFKTTAKSPVEAVILSYRVKRGFLGILKQAIELVIECLVKLCTGIYGFIKLVCNFILCIANRSRKTISQHGVALDSLSMSSVCVTEELTHDLCDLDHEKKTSVTSGIIDRERIQEHEAFSDLHSEFCPLDTKTLCYSRIVDQRVNPSSTLACTNSSEPIGEILQR